MPVEPTLPTTTPKIEPVAAPAKNKTHYVLTKPEALPAKHPTEAIESRKPEIPVEMQHPVPIQEEHILGAKEQHIYAAVGGMKKVMTC